MSDNVRLLFLVFFFKFNVHLVVLFFDLFYEQYKIKIFRKPVLQRLMKYVVF